MGFESRNPEFDIKALEERIGEMRARIPPHSVSPDMLEEIEELEERLQRAKAQAKDV